MPLSKPGTSATLPAAGGRVMRTIQHADSSITLEYQAVDTDGRVHPEEPPAKFTPAQVIAWFAAAVASPGSVPEVDDILAAHPGLTADDLVGARKVLFAYADLVALGFAETP